MNDKFKYVPNIKLDVKLIIDESKIDFLKCHSCKYICEAPVLCKDCENIFCKNCFTKSICICGCCKYKQTGKYIEKILEKIELKCIFCKDILLYSQYFQHLNYCERRNVRIECTDCLQEVIDINSHNCNNQASELNKYQQLLFELSNKLEELTLKVNHKDNIIKQISDKIDKNAQQAKEDYSNLLNQHYKLKNKFNKIVSKIHGLNYSTLYGHKDDVTCIIHIKWKKDKHTIATSSSDTTIRIWNIDKENCINVLAGHKECVLYIRQLIWSKNESTLVSCGGDKTIKLWNIDKAECLRTIEAHESYVNRVLHMRWEYNESTIVSTSVDATIKVWDCLEGTLEYVLNGHIGSISSVIQIDWECNNTTIATGGMDKTIRIWDLHSKACLGVLEGHEDVINEIIYFKWELDDSTIASVSDDCTLRLWNIDTLECIKIFENNSEVRTLIQINWERDPTIVSSVEGKMRFWHIEKEEYKDIDSDCGDIYCLLQVKYNSDITIITDSNQYQLKLWNC